LRCYAALRCDAVGDPRVVVTVRTETRDHDSHDLEVLLHGTVRVPLQRPETHTSHSLDDVRRQLNQKDLETRQVVSLTPGPNVRDLPKTTTEGPREARLVVREQVLRPRRAVPDHVRPVEVDILEGLDHVQNLVHHRLRFPPRIGRKGQRLRDALREIGKTVDRPTAVGVRPCETEDQLLDLLHALPGALLDHRGVERELLRLADRDLPQREVKVAMHDRQGQQPNVEVRTIPIRLPEAIHAQSRLTGVCHGLVLNDCRTHTVRHVVRQQPADHPTHGVADEQHAGPHHQTTSTDPASVLRGH
jgi:hypothetical protein